MFWRWVGIRDSKSKVSLKPKVEPPSMLIVPQEDEEVDDEEDSEYEKEARRQQQEVAAHLRPEDYRPAFSDQDTSEDDSDEDEKGTLGHRARLVCCMKL